MTLKILVVSDKATDRKLFEEALEPKGFLIEGPLTAQAFETTIIEHRFEAILVDFDHAGDRLYEWMALLQKNRSQSCLIIYGQNQKADKISEILQAGVYAFVPRKSLAKRIYATITGALENRKAFTEILAMMNELREVNRKLEKEKENLRKKNLELGFINRISKEIAYDLHWDRILPRIIDAGLLEIIQPSFLGLLYRLADQWNLEVCGHECTIKKTRLKNSIEDIRKNFLALAGERISAQKTLLHLYPAEGYIFSSSPPAETLYLPLSLTEKSLGMLTIRLSNADSLNSDRELMSTLSNMLAISLKNAQEYQKLKEMAVKDVLTGVYNRKGLDTFIKKEFHRAQRHQRPLSLVMIDVDNFKAVNDTAGHLAGDFILRKIACCIKNSVRQTDIVARYGGDEFVLLLPETDLHKARLLVKRVAKTIKTHRFIWKFQRIKIEISCGISTTFELNAGENEKDLLAKADSNLYRTKQSQSNVYPLANQVNWAVRN